MITNTLTRMGVVYTLFTVVQMLEHGDTEGTGVDDRHQRLPRVGVDRRRPHRPEHRDLAVAISRRVRGAVAFVCVWVWGGGGQRNVGIVRAINRGENTDYNMTMEMSLYTILKHHLSLSLRNGKIGFGSLSILGRRGREENRSHRELCIAWSLLKGPPARPRGSGAGW
jgi:hypothetical protein